MSSDLVKIIPKYGLSTSFLYALLKQKSFKAHAKGYSSGTTVLHLSKKCIPEYSVLLPNNLELIKPLSLELEEYVSLISRNIEISNVLRNLRDDLINSLFQSNNK